MINKTISEECGFPVVAHQLVYACTTGVVRAHISCYASAQQLLCGLGAYFFDNQYYLFRQLHPYSAIVSYALSFDIIRLRVFLFQVVSVPPPGLRVNWLDLKLQIQHCQRC